MRRGRGRRLAGGAGDGVGRDAAPALGGVSRGGAAADDTAGAFRVRPARATVHALHGPARDGVGLWPDPHGAAVGSPRAARAWEGTGGAEGPATERWEHGLLVAVATPERRAALGALWGDSRVAGARIGPVEAAAPEARDLAAMAALGRRGWLRPLARAFEHVGAKRSSRRSEKAAKAGVS